MKATLYKILSLKEGEHKLLALSCGFIFVLFSSYAILRPMRDALGLEGGKDELKWLFLGNLCRLRLFVSIAHVAKWQNQAEILC